MSFSPRSFFTNFAGLHSVKCHTSYEELPKSPLFYLLGRKSEGREQFHYYLYQDIFQGLRKRYFGINTESVEEHLEGREKIYERITTRTNVFGRLRVSDVREKCKWDQRMKDLRRVGWRCQQILLLRAGMAVE